MACLLSLLDHLGALCRITRFVACAGGADACVHRCKYATDFAFISFPAESGKALLESRLTNLSPGPMLSDDGRKSQGKSEQENPHLTDY